MKEKIKTTLSILLLIALTVAIFLNLCRKSGGECYYCMMDWDEDGVEECRICHCWDGRGWVCIWEHWGECKP